MYNKHRAGQRKGNAQRLYEMKECEGLSGASFSHLHTYKRNGVSVSFALNRTKSFSNFFGLFRIVFFVLDGKGFVLLKLKSTIFEKKNLEAGHLRIIEYMA